MLSSETDKHDFTRVEVLSYLSDQELAMLRKQCTACVFSAGNVIVERDEQDHSVYFILYGLSNIPVQVSYCGVDVIVYELFTFIVCSCIFIFFAVQYG